MKYTTLDMITKTLAATEDLLASLVILQDQRYSNKKDLDFFKAMGNVIVNFREKCEKKYKE